MTVNQNKLALSPETKINLIQNVFSFLTGFPMFPVVTRPPKKKYFKKTYMDTEWRTHTRKLITVHPSSFCRLGFFERPYSVIGLREKGALK